MHPGRLVRGRTRQRNPLPPPAIRIKPDLTAPLALEETSVPTTDAPMPRGRPSAQGNPRSGASCRGLKRRATGVPRGSVREGRRGRKRIVVLARRHRSGRVRAQENALQGTAVDNPPRGRLRVGRDRPTGAARVWAAATEGARLAPDRRGTKGKAATVRDSIKAVQVHGQAPGLDLNHPDRRRLAPVNSGQRIHEATDSEMNRLAARGRLKATAAPVSVLLHYPVLPAERAGAVRSQPVAAKQKPQGRDPAPGRV